MLRYCKLINIIVLAAVLVASASLFLCPTILLSTHNYGCGGNMANNAGNPNLLSIKAKLPSCVNYRFGITKIFNTIVPETAKQLLALIIIAVIIILPYFKKAPRTFFQNYLKTRFWRYFKPWRLRLSADIIRWLTLLQSHDSAFVIA